MDDRQRAREFLARVGIHMPPAEVSTRALLEALAAEFAAVRREALEECLRILEDPDLETYRDAIDRIRALATPTKPGDEP